MVHLNPPPIITAHLLQLTAASAALRPAAAASARPFTVPRILPPPLVVPRQPPPAAPLRIVEFRKLVKPTTKSIYL